MTNTWRRRAPSTLLFVVPGFCAAAIGLVQHFARVGVFERGLMVGVLLGLSIAAIAGLASLKSK